MKIVEKDVDELIEYVNNPRKNDEAVEFVAASIKEFGFKVPIVIDEENVIVAGHTRVKAARKLKLKTVPCIVASDLTKEQIKAFRLADNKTGEYAEWDNEKLKIEIEGLDEALKNVTGFSDEDIDLINFENVAYKEKEPEEKETRITITFEKPGDVRSVEDDLRELFKKYEKLKVVVSSGEV